MLAHNERLTPITISYYRFCCDREYIDLLLFSLIYISSISKLLTVSLINFIRIYRY